MRLAVGAAVLVALLASASPAQPTERTLSDHVRSIAKPADGAKSQKQRADDLAAEKEQKRAERKDETHQLARDNVDIQRKLVRLNRYLVVAAGASTVLLFLIAAYQAYISRDTARRQLRAYVGFLTGSIKSTSPTKAVATVQIKNFGQTPARNVVHMARVVVTGYPVFDQSLVIDPAKFLLVPKSMLHPGDTSIAEITGPPLTTEQRKTLDAETARVHVFGLITYTDSFGIERSSRYRLMLDSPLLVGGTTTLRFHPEGNDAD